MFTCIAFNIKDRVWGICSELLIKSLKQMYKTKDFLPFWLESISKLNIIFLNINWIYWQCYCFMFIAMVMFVIIEALDHSLLVINWTNREGKHLFQLSKKQERALFSCLNSCNQLLQSRITSLFHFQLFDLNLYLQKNLQGFRFNLLQFATFVTKISKLCLLFVVLVLVKFQD